LDHLSFTAKATSIIAAQPALFRELRASGASIQARLKKAKNRAKCYWVDEGDSTIRDDQEKKRENESLIPEIGCYYE
jgi:hypothetical protein